MPLKKKFKQIKVKVCCVPDCEDQFEEAFYGMLDDYCTRFNVTPRPGKHQVNIFFAEIPEMCDGGFARGIHFHESDTNKVTLQIRDPILNGWEDNPYTVLMMLETFSHEVVHACQTITGRKGISVRAKVDKKDDEEKYFFDPFEIEARLLEGFYTSKFCMGLL